MSELVGDDLQLSTGAPIQRSRLESRGCLECIDGRVTNPRLGAPGGDIGEFILIAGALEAELGVSLSEPWFHQALSAIVEARGSLYMHTDRAAWERLASRSGVSVVERTRGNAPLTPEKRRAWFDAVTEPECTGCGHLRAMLENPRLYGVGERLVRRTIEAYFKLYFSGAAVRLDVLDGVHRELGMVQVFAEGSEEVTFTPAVGADGSAFVEHPDARVIVRDANLDLLASAGLLQRSDSLERVRERIDAMEIRHREATLALLAPDIDRVRVSEPYLEAAAE